MAEIKIATDANFEELVLKSDRPTVVDFWAAWCGPCKMVAPEMEKLAEKYDGAVDVVKVDVDANPGLSQAFNILSIPVIAFFKPGSQPQGVVGFRPLEQLEQTFNLAEYAVSRDRGRRGRAGRLTVPFADRSTPVPDRGRSIHGVPTMKDFERLIGAWHGEGEVPIEPPMRITSDATFERLGEFFVFKSVGQPAEVPDTIAIIGGAPDRRAAADALLRLARGQAAVHDGSRRLDLEDLASSG